MPCCLLACLLACLFVNDKPVQQFLFDVPLGQPKFVVIAGFDNRQKHKDIVSFRRERLVICTILRRMLARHFASEYNW